MVGSAEGWLIMPTDLDA